MKKFASLLLTLVLALSLAACGSGSSSVVGSSSGASQGSTSGAPVQISFWHHMEGVNAEALELVCQQFNDTVGKEKGIVVTPSFQGTNTGEKLNTLAQAGDWKSFPDACQVASAAIPTIHGYDMFVSIDEMYNSGGEITLQQDSIIANNARTFSYMEELCAMPFSNSTILLYYNKDAFAEVGLDPENPPTTLEELAKAAELLLVKNGDEVERYGLNVQVKRYQLVNWIGGQGDYNFIGDNEGGRAGMMTKFTFGDDGSLMKYLDEWEKIIATGAYKPIEDNINEEFAMGISAMAIMSSARISKVESLVAGNFEWGTAALPMVSSTDKGGAAVGGSGVVMFDHDDDARKEATWAFVQYLGDVDAQYEFCTRSGYIPMNKDVYETDQWKAYEQENTKIVAAVQQLMASNPNVQEPFDLVTGEVNTIIDEEMTKFAQGEQDKQTTHDNIVTRCNDKVAEYVSVNG